MKYILCAAIKVSRDLFTGKNHGECLGKLKRNTEQGFIADEYSGTQFVDREKALEIARNANQITSKHFPKNILLSEDMRGDKLFRGGK